MSVKNFKDFKGLKEENIAELESIGINTVDDLVKALDDEAKVKEIIKTLSGVGPKTVMKWKEIAAGEAAPAKKEEAKPAEKKATRKEERAAKKAAKKEEKADKKADKKEAEEEKVEVVEDAAKVYIPAKKAKISGETADDLAKRALISGRRPAFKRQEWYRYSKLGEAWRRPKGIHSKMRRHFKRRVHMVDIGYRGPAAVRGLHPSGFEEVLIHNVDGLQGLDPEKQAVRIGGTVGSKKRIAIQDKADELGIRVLNRMV